MKSGQAPSNEQLVPTSALGVSLALAAGATLPSKADAVVVVSNASASIGPNSSPVLAINFDHSNGTINIQTNAGLTIGWNFRILGTAFDIDPFDGNGAFYYGLGNQQATNYIDIYLDPPPAIDLASPPYPSGWSLFSVGDDPVPSPGTRFFVGLRKDVGLDSYYGWAEFEAGSATHIRTAFETQANTGIIFGQIPEPSSAALLLTAGLAGVSACRRRRLKR